VGKKTGKMKPGTFILREVIMSRAYHALSGFAPQLLILFLSKRDIRKTDKVCTNSDSITMTYAELENIYNQGQEFRGLPKDGISRPRIIRAFNDLLEKGFISIVRQGGAYKQDKSIYALENDWRQWKPGDVFKTRKKDSRTLGYRKPQNQMSRTETLPIHTHENVTHTAQ